MAPNQISGMENVQYTNREYAIQWKTKYRLK